MYSGMAKGTSQAEVMLKSKKVKLIRASLKASVRQLVN